MKSEWHCIGRSGVTLYLGLLWFPSVLLIITFNRNRRRICFYERVSFRPTKEIGPPLLLFWGVSRVLGLREINWEGPFVTVGGSGGKV